MKGGIVADIALSILFHGLASAMVLYIIAVGLSVTMGLMGFVNLAHGVFAMAGGYVAIWLMQSAGIGFLPAVLIACIGVALVSVPVERTLYARLYGASELDQVLMTIGLIFVASAAARFLFGPSPQNLAIPSLLQGQVDLGIRSFPAYRLVIIALGFLLFVALWLMVERTPFGARLRAAVDNRKIAQSIGIRTDHLFTFTFALGSGLAALGGALGAEFLPIRPAYAAEQLNNVLIVVAVGGLGTLQGPFLAAILLGVSDTACRYLAPELGVFFIYLVIIVLLLWRPNGLYGRAG
jgi:branched-chain amino acid transport system permease protein